MNVESACIFRLFSGKAHSLSKKKRFVCRIRCLIQPSENDSAIHSSWPQSNDLKKIIKYGISFSKRYDSVEWSDVKIGNAIKFYLCAHWKWCSFLCVAFHWTVSYSVRYSSMKAQYYWRWWWWYCIFHFAHESKYHSKYHREPYLMFFFFIGILLVQWVLRLSPVPHEFFIFISKTRINLNFYAFHFSNTT